MFINSSQSRIEGLSSFPAHAQPRMAYNYLNSSSQQPIISSDSMQELMDINQQNLVIKIGKLIHQLVHTKQKIFLYEDLCYKLRIQNNNLQKKLKQLEVRLNTNISELQQKINTINQKQKQIIRINEQKCQLTKQIKKMKQKQQEGEILRTVDQDAKIKKRLKQVSKINQILERQLKIANSKIVELERVIQDKTCSQFIGQLYRIRQNSMKSTILQENVRLKTQVPMNDAGSNYFKSQALHRTRAISTKNYRF